MGLGFGSTCGSGFRAGSGSKVDPDLLKSRSGSGIGIPKKPKIRLRSRIQGRNRNTPSADVKKITWWSEQRGMKGFVGRTEKDERSCKRDPSQNFVDLTGLLTKSLRCLKVFSIFERATMKLRSYLYLIILGSYEVIDAFFVPITL